MTMSYPAFVRSLSEGQVLDVAGTRVTEMLSGHETIGGNYVFRQTLPPASGVPPHVHSLEDEIVFVLSGELEVFVDGQVSTACSGAVLNFARGYFHGFKVKGHQPCETLWVVSPGTNFQAFLRDFATFPPGPPDFVRLAALNAKHGITMPPPSATWW